MAVQPEFFLQGPENRSKKYADHFGSAGIRYSQEKTEVGQAQTELSSAQHIMSVAGLGGGGGEIDDMINF